MPHRRDATAVGQVRVRSAVEQNLYGLLVFVAAIAQRHGFDQRGQAQVVCGIGWNAGLHEFIDDFDIATTRGRDERGVAVSVGGAQVGAVRQG